MHAGSGTDPAKVPAKRSVTQCSFQEAIQRLRPGRSPPRPAIERQSRLRSSVDRAPGFEPDGRRFKSCRGRSGEWCNGNTPALHVGTFGSNPSSSTTSCPDRLLVRILGFQPGGQSSILCRGANTYCEVTQLAESSVVTRVVGGSIPPFAATPHASLAKLENAAGLDPVVLETCGFDSHGKYFYAPWRDKPKDGDGTGFETRRAAKPCEFDPHSLRNCEFRGATPPCMRTVAGSNPSFSTTHTPR